MTELTEDELQQLDVERAKEAERAVAAKFGPTLDSARLREFIAIEAARLGRIGGNIRPVDPAVLVVRRLLGASLPTNRVAQGVYDTSPAFKSAIAELRTICAEKGWEL